MEFIVRFVGRGHYFDLLDAEMRRVGPGESRFVAVRGRRQVGKSRLLTEWLRARGHRHLYYQALDKPVSQELDSFSRAVARSNLGALADLAASGARWSSWEQALEVGELAAGEGDGPPVLVIDELPYVVGNDPSFEGTLQAVWDHRLQHAGLLLVVVGSDVSMMEAIFSYGRPLYQRPDRQVRVAPLNVAEAADLLDLEPAAAFDTYLVTGGFPKVLAARAEHDSTRSFIDEAVADEAHPLVFTGQQTLDTEFPPAFKARAVLEAVGAGERAFNKIATRAGVTGQTLATSLELLADKGVVAVEDPLCARRVGKRTRYRVADPYLRFWLQFLAGRIGDIERGRGDLVAADIEAGWQSYVGEAVEPLVRESIANLLPDARLGDTRRVGAYWTRSHDVEVDLVGTAGDPPVDRVELVGSVKWRASQPFDREDANRLDRLADHVPGRETTTVTVGVSRTGFTRDAGLDVALGPAELLHAWRGHA